MLLGRRYVGNLLIDKPLRNGRPFSKYRKEESKREETYVQHLVCVDLTLEEKLTGVFKP